MPACCFADLKRLAIMIYKHAVSSRQQCKNHARGNSAAQRVEIRPLPDFRHGQTMCKRQASPRKLSRPANLSTCSCFVTGSASHMILQHLPGYFVVRQCFQLPWCSHAWQACSLTNSLLSCTHIPSRAYKQPGLLYLQRSRLLQRTYLLWTQSIGDAVAAGCCKHASIFAAYEGW